MTREIEGVAYSPDYEDIVGPIPDGTPQAKVIQSTPDLQPAPSSADVQTKRR